MRKGSQMFSVGDRFWFKFDPLVRTIISVDTLFVYYKTEVHAYTFSATITLLKKYEQDGDLIVKKFKRSIDMDVVADL